MGKKAKIKTKLAAKKEKLVAKLKGKKVKKAITATAMLCVAFFLCGCQSTPSRSQSQTIRDCTFYVMLPAGFNPTNAVAIAGGEQTEVGVIGDLFTQNQVVENSGSETLSPTHTVSTPTQLSYGVGGGSSWADFWSGLKQALGGGGSASAASAPASGTAAACANGSCSDASSGTQ